MREYLIALIISLVAGYFIASFPLRGIDRLLPFKRILKLGIVKMFPNQEKALKHMIKDIKKSKILHVLATKGSTFSNGDIYNA